MDTPPPDLARLAYDSAPTGIVLTEQRVIRTCNATFAQLLGYQVDELVGQSFRVLYGSDEEFEDIRDIGLILLQQTGQYIDERLVRHRAGHGIWCRFRARTLVPQAPLERVVMSFAPINDAEPITLSKRERQVLELMNRRLTSKEIAKQLGLSPRTIDDVRSRLIKRFGVRRAQDLLGRLSGRQG
ncbi:helix-turn-helix transcriptional regulator [Pararhodobacter zhoushanensis]|uniref:helix-turn-helix transcriptional regulator n=1 Tax=Pararhodobacter zhoushanensis TaxID=2479545 RepID=UPI000F8E940B|nr:helix-turn-helix transcriptional regulator [Pararhodobacter zhoushanensis]